MKSGLMLGVNPNAKRQKEDFYATDPKALKLFLDKLSKDGVELQGAIWECACGQGHLAEELKRSGYNIKATDLIDRGYGEVQDFLQCNTNEPHTSILTNPPFKLAEKFVEKGIELIDDGYNLCLFLKIQFLEGQKRKILFEKYPPKYIYIYILQDSYVLKMESLKSTHLQPNVMLGIYGRKGIKEKLLLDGYNYSKIIK